MNAEPLVPYVVEIIQHPEASGAIIAGGLGMRLKQEHLRRIADARGHRVTLISEVPEARATQDIDLFLSVGLWVPPGRAQALLRVLADRLGYDVITYNWQFRKPVDGITSRHIRLDLHARPPRLSHGEPVKVRGNPRQVGREMGTGLAGRETPEAFAIDDLPVTVTVVHQGAEYAVLVPHPYAWINMKVRAAYDLIRERRGDPDVEQKLTKAGDRVRLKHVFDVYVLVAMLTQQEREEAIGLAERYADHEEARKTREQAAALYGAPDAPGMSDIQEYARKSLGRTLDVDYDLFWNEGLRPALGL